jgi:hypothetical protein
VRTSPCRSEWTDTDCCGFDTVYLALAERTVQHFSGEEVTDLSGSFLRTSDSRDQTWCMIAEGGGGRSGWRARINPLQMSRLGDGVAGMVAVMSPRAYLCSQPSAKKKNHQLHVLFV